MMAGSHEEWRGEATFEAPVEDQDPRRLGAAQGGKEALGVRKDGGSCAIQRADIYGKVRDVRLVLNDPDRRGQWWRRFK